MQRRHMIVQMDRVASVEEAVAFRDAGANLIGVALDPDPRFEDARFVSADTAMAIQRAIAPVRVVGLVPSYFYDDSVAQSRARIERILELGPAFVQFYRGVRDELVPMVRAAGVPVIMDDAKLDVDDGAYIEPNDPASWVRGQLEDRAELNPALFHLDVVPNAPDPWLFLTDEALEWPDECPQVADVAAATREFRLLLSLTGVGADTIGPYVQAFPDARGFFARLGPDRMGGAPSSKPEPLLAALQALQAAGAPSRSECGRAGR